jgi:putative SOS response-associated peptidase YedK
MCGRFTLDLVDLSELPEWLAADHVRVGEWQPRYNIAPSQTVPVLVATGAERTLLAARWGFLPRWAQEPAVGNRMINARVESVARSPAFRAAFRNHRCVVPATGFFEWGDGPRPRQPFFIHPSAGGVIALAGVWGTWISQEGEAIDSFSIVTTAARGVVSELHDRMPLILPSSAIERWLGPEPIGPDELERIIQSSDASELTAHPVTTRVNSSRVDDPELIAPMADSDRHAPAQLSLLADLVRGRGAELDEPHKK